MDRIRLPYLTYTVELPRNGHLNFLSCARLSTDMDSPFYGLSESHDPSAVDLGFEHKTYKHGPLKLLYDKSNLQIN